MAIQTEETSRSDSSRARLLRPSGVHSDEVAPIELFFDLVYVLAITQLSHHLLAHLSVRGAIQSLVLLMAVWAGWINTAWISNYFDVRRRPVRLALLGGMFAGLVMSASIPGAFADRGLSFAIGVSTILIGGSLLALIAVGSNHHLRAVFDRVVVWWVGVAVLWIGGALFEGDTRLAIWVVASILPLVVIFIGFPLPGFGRNLTTDYTISGAHMAERCLLFIILALGESIVITGASFGEIPRNWETWAAFVVAFIGSIVFWWIYFDRAEEMAREKIANSDDPGRLGVYAYTYFHIPMVAGIIVAAAADEVSIAHPSHDVTIAAAGLILGGPALYLVGNLLFKIAIFEYVPKARLIALAALVALIPVATVATNLQLAVAATIVLIALAIWDYRLEMSGQHPAFTLGREGD